MKTRPTPCSLSKRSFAPEAAVTFNCALVFSMSTFVHTPFAGASIVTGIRTFCPGHHSQMVISTSFWRIAASLGLGCQSSITFVSSVEVSRIDARSNLPMVMSA